MQSQSLGSKNKDNSFLKNNLYIFFLLLLAFFAIQGISQSSSPYFADNNGSGKRKTGGTSVYIDLKAIGDNDTLSFKCLSGQCQFVMIHGRTASGKWDNLQQSRMQPVKMNTLLRKKRNPRTGASILRSTYTHLVISVNGYNEMYSKKAGRVEIRINSGSGSTISQNQNPSHNSSVNLITRPRKGGQISLNTGTGQTSSGTPALIYTPDRQANHKLSFDCLSGNCQYIAIHGIIYNNRSRALSADGDLLYKGPLKAITLHQLHKNRAYYYYYKILVNGSYKTFDRIPASVEVSLQKAAGRFNDNQNGTVTDTETKRVWQRCSAGQNNAHCSGTAKGLAWSQAIQYCKDLRLAGRSDWRLPNGKELSSLQDNARKSSRQYPLIDTAIFPAPTNSHKNWQYWTDQKKDWQRDIYYMKNLYSQSDFGYQEGKYSYFARCIAGGTPSTLPQGPSEKQLSFRNNNNGTIVDLKTNFVWQRCAAGQSQDNSCSGNAQTMNWSQAKLFCQKLNLAGRRWQLPNSADFNGISYQIKVPAIDENYFKLPFTTTRKNAAISFWTSSPQDSSRAWTFDVLNGNRKGSIPISTKAQRYVRCVSK